MLTGGISTISAASSIYKLDENILH
jgi:hypothetical protein